MTSNEARANLIHDLADIIRQLIWQGHKQSTTTLDRLDITLPQAVVLVGLEARHGRSTMSELVRITQQSPGTLTGIVDRLISAGLVERAGDPNDRRIVYVVLTELGEQKIAAIHAQREDDIRHMTADFSDDELVLFKSLMVRLLARLETAIE